MPAPDCGQSSLRSGPALKEQLFGVLPSNCPQPLEVSQRRRVCPGLPASLSPAPQGQPVRTCDCFSPPHEGKVASHHLPGQAGAPPRMGPHPPSWNGCPACRAGDRNPVSSVLDPTLKAWPSLTPHSPHAPNTHASGGDCPWLYLGRRYTGLLCFSQTSQDSGTLAQGHVLFSETQQHLNSLGTSSPAVRIFIWIGRGHTWPFPSTALLLGCS